MRIKVMFLDVAVVSTSDINTGLVVLLKIMIVPVIYLRA